ncbi:hypothetical protein P9112_000562 [Eukaryota sp. TZLM1-RC]
MLSSRLVFFVTFCFFLVNSNVSTFICSSTSSWTDPSCWNDNVLPGEHSDVVFPKLEYSIQISLDEELSVLSLVSQGDNTFVVGDGASLQVSTTLTLFGGSFVCAAPSACSISASAIYINSTVSINFDHVSLHIVAGNSNAATFTLHPSATLFLSPAFGSIITWGSNEEGQLGLGSTNDSFMTPLSIGFPSPVSAVTSGDSHVLALLSDGSLASWGRNNFGQLGINSLNPQSHSSIIPLHNASSICANGDFSLGSDVFGMEGAIGLGPHVDYRATPVLLEGIPSIETLDCGFQFSHLLDSANKLWVCGPNDYGQLGLADPHSRRRPTENGLSDVDQFSCGIHHTLVLLNSGTLKSYGLGNKGQIGDGNIHNRHNPVTVRITGTSPIVSVKTSGYNSMILFNNGSIAAWGDNQHSQLGLPHHTHEIYRSPVLIPNRSGSFITLGFDFSIIFSGVFAEPEHSPITSETVSISRVDSYSFGQIHGTLSILAHDFDVYCPLDVSGKVTANNSLCNFHESLAVSGTMDVSPTTQSSFLSNITLNSGNLNVEVLSIASDFFLVGNGVIGGDLKVYGTFQPNGTLFVNGDLTLHSTSTTVIDLVSKPTIIVEGTLSIEGSIDLEWDFSQIEPGSNFTLFKFSELNGDFSFELPEGCEIVDLVYSEFSIIIEISPIVFLDTVYVSFDASQQSCCGSNQAGSCSSFKTAVARLSHGGKILFSSGTYELTESVSFEELSVIFETVSSEVQVLVTCSPLTKISVSNSALNLTNFSNFTVSNCDFILENMTILSQNSNIFFLDCHHVSISDSVFNLDFGSSLKFIDAFSVELNGNYWHSNHSKFVISADSLNGDDISLVIQPVSEVSLRSVDGNYSFSNASIACESILDVSSHGGLLVRYFNHHGGTRTGDTELVISDFYHWNSGLLISKTTHSSTIIKGEGLFDGNKDLNLENHKLIIEGHAVWNSGNFVLNSNGEFNVPDQGLLTINLDSNGIITGDSDSNSLVSNYGKVEKICESPLSIDAKVVNNGNFVIRNGTLDLNQEFDIVNGNLSLENPGKLNLNNILNVRESGSLESYSLLLLNNSNSQLIVAGNLDVAESIIIDSFGSAVFQGEAFVSKLKVKVINGNVEFKENVQVDSLFVDVFDGLVEFNDNSKISSIPTLNLFGGSVSITDFTNITSIESINLHNESFIQIEGNSEVYLSNSLINFYDNSLFKVSENAVLITLGIEVYLHNSCKFELLSQCNGHFSSLNLLQDSTFDYSCFGDFYIATFNHYGGTRTGDTELVINDFYHWNSGLLTSKTTHSSTIIKGEGIFDGNKDLNLENHKLIIEGHAVWNSGNFVLNSNGEFNVSDQGLLTINLDSSGVITGDSDSNSFVSNYGKVEKICESLLSIDAKVVNNGNFVIRNGTVDLNQEFDIVTGNLLLENPGKLNLNNILNVRESGSLESYSLLLLNNSNSQLIVAGNLDVAENIIIDSFGSAVFQGEAFVSKLKVKVINGNVEFKENVQVDSLFVDLFDGLVEFNGNSKISLIPTLNLFGGSVGITDFANITSIESINLYNESFVQINGNSEVYLSNSLINFYDNSLFKVSENAVLITLGSEVYLHNSCKFELLSQCNGHFSSLDLLQDSTLDYSCFGDFYIATFNHYGGTRTGDTELVINDFYHWNSGLLTSKTTHSSTMIKGEGLFDGNEDLNLENHKLLIEGHAAWNSGNFVLNSNGEFNVSDQGLLTINLDSSGIITGDSDSNSLVSNYGKVEKICESLLSIDAKVVNNGNFVIRNGTLDLNQEFDIVTGNLLLENPGKLNLNNILNVRESGSLESYSLLLLNNSNSQLIVAGYLDVAENIIIDSFGSAVFQGEAFVSKLKVKVINGNVEFKENVQVDSLFVDLFDGLVEFNGNSKVSLIPTLNLFGGSVGITDFANITSIDSINLYNESFVQIDGNSEVYLSNSLINFYDNSLFKVSENAVLITLGSEVYLHNSCQFELLSHCNGHFSSLNLLQDSTFDYSCFGDFYIATFNHHGGTRTGDTELVINDFYQWNSGLLTSKTTHSSTMIKGEGLFDGNEDLIMENHKLIIEGHAAWNSGNFVLNSNGEFNVSDQGLLTINLDSSGIITGDSDSNSLVSNYGKVEKICESLLSIDAKVVNNGNFVIRNGTLDLNQEFDIVTGNLLLENPGKLNLNNILNVRESGSLESYSLLLLNNSNSQLIVAGYLDVAENIIIDSFGSAVFQGEAFVSKLKVKVINGNVEFKENVQVDSLFVDLFDGLVEFNGNSMVSLIPTLNLFGGSVGITDFANITSIDSINLYNESFVQIDGNSEVYLSNSLINFYDNSLFKVSENAVLITLGSEVYLHNSCQFELLSHCNGHFSSLNLLQDSTFDYSCFGDFYIATFNHHGGTRTGDTELVINDFYQWNSGLLTSKTTHSSTMIKGEGLFDGNEDLIMENHKLIIEGHAVWNSGNFVLNSNGEFNVSDQGLFTIDLNSSGIITGDSDSNSLVSNYGKVEKICESLLSIDAKVVNNGNFVIRNGTADLNQEFDIVNGNLLLENPGKLNLNNILNVRESGSLESYSLLLLNNSNSQLIVAGNLVVAENIIIDSFGSAVFQGEAFVSKLMVKVINGNVEFKESVQVDLLFVDLFDGLVEFNGNSKVSLIPTLNLFGGSVGITDFANITSIESINLYNESFIQIDGNSEVYLSNSLINFYDNSLFKVSENAVLITLGSEVYLHNSGKFELVSQCNGHFSSLNLLQDSTFDYSCFGDFYIATFNHHGGTRTGDTELVINDFYHWNSGLFTSKTTHSSTIIKGEGLFDGNEDLNLENHKLIIEGHAVWNSGNFVLNSNGEFNVSDQGLLTINLDSSGIITGDSDSNSFVSNYGKVEKICESLLSIDAKVVNNGNFVIRNGTLDLNQEFDIVNGNLLLENPGKLNLNNILNVRESGSLESYSLLLLNNSNSQLIVAGNLDVAENIIIDSFGSAVFQGEAFVSKLMVKVINGNVEFKENVQVDSLFVDVFDGLVEFNGNSKVTSIPTLNLFGGSVGITDFANVTSIESINLYNESFIQIDGNSEVYLSNSLINFYDNSLFKVSENAVLITLGSEVYLHNSCKFELLSQCNGHFSSLDLLQDSTLDYSCFGDFYIATFNHHGGTRTGDTELVINDFYHWNSGLLISKTTHSSTIIKGEGLFDGNEDLNLENHKLIIEGHAVWNSGNFVLNSNGEFNVSDQGLLTINLDSSGIITGDSDSNSLVSNYGKVEKICESPLSIDAKVVNNGNFVIRNGTLDLNQEFDIVNGNLLLENPGKLYLNNILNVRESGSLESYSLLLLNNSNSQLIVAGNLDVAENIIIDSFGSAVFQGEAFVSKLMVKVINGNVEFKENVQVDSLFVDVFDGLVEFNGNSKVTSIPTLNLFGGSVGITDFANVTSIESINLYNESFIQIDGNSEVYLSNSLINFYDNSLFKVSENAVLITLGSEVYLHNSCKFELLSQCNGHFSSLDLLQDSTLDYSCFGDFYIATFNHYGGTRTGDTELVINDFYHWNSGLLTSKTTHSSTIIKGEGLFDGNEDLNLENHKLLIEGHTVWNSGNFVLNSNGEFNVSDQGLFTIDLNSSGIITGDSDSNSLVSNYGKVEKICESLLSIDAKVVNNGNFVIRNGTLDLNQEFDIVNGNLLLENPGKLNLNNILNVRESGSLESYSLLLLNNSNSQLIVAGYLDVAENIIIDSFGSAVFQGEAFVSKLMVKVINGNVEFKENVQVDSFIC